LADRPLSMQTLLSSHADLAIVAALGIAVYRLPKFGQAVLAFLRDLDDYRANRR
jgi:hypothetical protein